MTARDDTNYRVNNYTRIVSQSPSQDIIEFYETLSFGKQNWQDIEISLWEADEPRNEDDQITPEQKFSIAKGENYHKHCDDANCNIYLSFYTILISSDCSSNPCNNGGTCTEFEADYRCSCTTGYTGSQCQNWSGYLRVYACYATNLPDIDSGSRESDPFIVVVATDVHGYKETLATRHIPDEVNPTWNEWLMFRGRRAWNSIEVTVYDRETNFALTETSYHTEIMKFSYNSRYSFSICSTQGCSNNSGAHYYYVYFQDNNQTPTDTNLHLCKDCKLSPTSGALYISSIGSWDLYGSILYLISLDLTVLSQLASTVHQFTVIKTIRVPN